MNAVRPTNIKLPILQHLKTDNKLIWVAIMAVGYLTGNLADVATIFYPIFDNRYITVEQLEDIKCDCPATIPLNPGTNPGVVPVNPETGMITPKVVPNNGV